MKRGWAKACAGYAFGLVQATFGVTLSRRLAKLEYLADRYNDGLGRASAAFFRLGLDSEERLKWLEAWHAIDSEATDAVAFDAFTAFLALEDRHFARRLFDVYDTRHTGTIAFADFLSHTFDLCHFGVLFMLLTFCRRLRPRDL